MRIVLDPFNEKYACCWEWWLSSETSHEEEEVLARIFGQFTCPVCGRRWGKEGDVLVLEE